VVHNHLARPNTKSLLGEGKPVPDAAPRAEVRSKEGEWRGRGGARLSVAPGSMAGAYDVDLTVAIEELGPTFRDSLNTVLLYLIHVSIAKKRMTLVNLQGPVYPANSKCGSVASGE
jgi:hypothetical protein